MISKKENFVPSPDKPFTIYVSKLYICISQ